MRRRFAPLLVATLALAPCTLSAQAAPDPATGPFAPLAFLAGSCWQGTFPDGKATDEHCFEWAYDGAFLRDRHVVRPGTYQGETLYAADRKTGALSFTYWNSLGQVMTGTVETRGDTLRFPQRTEGPDGPVEILSTWTRPGPDRYRVEVTQTSGGATKVLWTMELRRRAS